MAKSPFPIEKPTVLLDETRARANIARMTEKARKSGVRLRPHFKTHQSHKVGQWFREQGIEAITVSSLDMAEYFARAGWQDITVAFPANPLEAEKINRLAAQVTLHILVDNPETVAILSRKLTVAVNVWIKVDAGYGRVGVPWHRKDRLRAVAQAIIDADQFRFQGLLTHFGHTYHAHSPDEIRRIYRQSLDYLHMARAVCRQLGFSDPALSIGDTPSCSVVSDFKGVDEIRPGNFVFYDLTQERLGSCTDRDIAVAVACPVVGIFTERNEVAIYGGGVHFSKEALRLPDGRVVYGVLAVTDARGWKQNPSGWLVSLSQEHGILTVSRELLQRIRVGDTVTIFPVHSCLTTNLYKSYKTLTGEEIYRFQSLF